MLRATATLLVLVSVLASTALAAGDALPETDASDAPAPLADALGKAGDAIATGASAIGSGAKAAGSGLANLAGAIGSGIAALATAVGHGIVAALKGIGSGIAWLASALGSLLSATFALLGKALGALWNGLIALASLIGGLLASLFKSGVSFTRAHPAPVAIGAGSAAAAGGLAWLLKRLGGLGALAALYTRLAPSRMLDNEVRARVYDHVKAHPGAHPSAIAQRLDLGWGTVVYHLAKLEETRLVTARNAHNRKCYFAITADLDADARTAVAAMSTDKTRTIVEAVRARPGISQKELSETLGISQALASWHVKRLVESGVLTTQREGRSNCLRVASHVPGAVAA